MQRKQLIGLEDKKVWEFMWTLKTLQALDFEAISLGTLQNHSLTSESRAPLSFFIIAQLWSVCVIRTYLILTIAKHLLNIYRVPGVVLRVTEMEKEDSVLLDKERSLLNQAT